MATGSEPNTRSARCWSAMPTPDVAMNGIITYRPRTGRMASRSTTSPTTAATSIPPASTPKKLVVTCRIVRYAPKAPAMKNSGCAMLTTRITLNTSEKPRATTAYVLPIMSPLSTCWRKSSIRESASQVHTLDVLAGHQRGGGALGGEPPDLEQVCVVRDLERLPCVLLDHEDGEAARVDLPDLLEQALDDLGREAQRGLVHDQQPRLGDEGARDGEHLLLAAGQRAGELAPPLAQERKQREHLVDARREARTVAPRERAHLEILVDGERREELSALGHPGHAELVDAVRRRAVDRSALELDRAAGLHEAEDRLDGAALPRAVGAEDGADLAGGHLERHALDGGHGPVADLEVLHPEQEAHASAPRWASMTSAFFRTSAG